MPSGNLYRNLSSTFLPTIFLCSSSIRWRSATLAFQIARINLRIEMVFRVNLGSVRGTGRADANAGVRVLGNDE